MPLVQIKQIVGGAGLLSFVNIAALAAYDDTTCPDNTPVYVETVRSVFRKRIEPNPGTADAITNVRNPTDTATWYREGLANRSWNDESVWYISAAAGDDENDGQTALTPIQTLGELTRRTVGAEPRPDFTLNVLNSGIAPLTGTWTLNVENGVEVFGEIILGPPSALPISAVQAFNRATNTPQRVTVPWPVQQDPLVPPMWETSSTGLWGWNTFRVAGDDYETKFWDSGGDYLDPALGETVSERRRPYFGGPNDRVSINLNGAEVAFYGLVFHAVVDAQGGSIYAEQCSFPLGTFFKGGEYFAADLSHLTTGRGPPAITVVDTTWIFLFADVLLSFVFVNRDTSLSAGNDILLQSEGRFYAFGGQINLGSVEARRTIPEGTFVLRGPESSMTINAVAANDQYLYGNNNTGPIISIQTNGCRVYYRDQAAFVVDTSAAADWERPGPVTGLWAALPTVNPSLFVGIVLHG